MSCKWQFAGNLMRKEDGRWNMKVTEWRPRSGIIFPGRPKTRWRDNIGRITGNQWISKTVDRSIWKQLREVSMQQWTY